MRTEDHEERARATLEELALAHLSGAAVILFGSRASGTNHRRSDFDLAYLPRKDFDPSGPIRLREALDSSNLIYEVDLLNLSQTSEEFREKVLREGTLWRS